MNNKLFLKRMVLVFLPLLIMTSCAEKTPTTSQRIDTFFSNGVVNGFNGALYIEKNGKIIINKGYGLANKEQGTPITSHTIFDIGSNTKQFTGAAVLKLAESNKLKITDSLHIFFDDVPVDKKDITVHQLLTHTSGLQESLDSDFASTTTTQFFTDVFKSELYREPGAEFNYSNLGYSILARIIELASEMEYEAFLNTTLFSPTGMTQTGYLLPKWAEDHLAIGYNRNIIDMGSTVRRYLEDGSVSWHLKGNGGINSTQHDLLLWYKAIKSNEILSRSSVEKWTKPYVAELNDNMHYYGYGWGLKGLHPDSMMVSHNGGNGAFSHTMIWSPKEDFIIIYATNASSPIVENLALEAERMMSAEDYLPKEIKKNPYFFVTDFIKNNAPTEVNKLKELILTEYPDEFNSPEALNRLGYIILRSEENIEWAIELFKLNTRLFPDDGNAWDSLGEAYIASKQSEEAIKSLQRAIELNNIDSKKKLHDLITTIN